LTLEIHAGPNVKCPIFWSVSTNIITSQHITAQHQQQPLSSSPPLADIVKLTDAILYCECIKKGLNRGSKWLQRGKITETAIHDFLQSIQQVTEINIKLTGIFFDSSKTI
jgi:hypothetical protein